MLRSGNEILMALIYFSNNAVYYSSVPQIHGYYLDFSWGKPEGLLMNLHLSCFRLLYWFLYSIQDIRIVLKIFLIFDINIWYISFFNFDFFTKFWGGEADTWLLLPSPLAGHMWPTGCASLHWMERIWQYHDRNKWISKTWEPVWRSEG